MADNDFRFATNVFDTDGTNKVYDLSFQLGYIEKEYVFATSGVIDPDTGLLTDTISHVVSFIDENDGNRVQVTPVPAAGRTLLIFRQTDISNLIVQWSDGKLVNGRNLDLSAKQLLMAIQEIMDGLRSNNILVEGGIETIIDLDRLIREIYNSVIALIESGGIISVNPLKWSFVTEEGTLDYPIVGANLDNPAMYDVALDGLVLFAGRDYNIGLVDNDPLQTVISLAIGPSDNQDLVVTLRGFAQPYQGAPPATLADLRTPIRVIPTAVYFPDIADDRAVLRSDFDEAVTVTVRVLPEAGVPMSKLWTGSYYSVVQEGVGQISITADAGVTLVFPSDCLARTRAQGALVTLTCLDAENNIWHVSGDMAQA